MLHGAQSRPGRRVAGRGGSAGRHAATLPRSRAATGQHRVRACVTRHRAVTPAPQRRAPRELHHTMQLLMSGLGAVIMLSICGLGTFFIVADERRGRDAQASSVVASARTRDISSRAVDPRPLTVQEVFPAVRLQLGTDRPPYRVRMTHADTDCDKAVTGELVAMLDDLGCSQVVRATLTTPAEGYLVTAGVFNLADSTGTARAHEQIKPVVDSGRGRFAGMPTGPGSEFLEDFSAQVGWHTRGHYLVYCVIARSDGQLVGDDDPQARRILYDIIQRHLRQDVLGRRATAGPAVEAV